MKTRHFIGMAAALQMTFFAAQASAVVIGFDGGTATLADGSTVTTTNTTLEYPVISYEEQGVLMQLNADTEEGVYIGDYYNGAGNAVIHAHWDAVVETGLQSITFSMVNGSAFDMNYMDITSNTTCGGCAASGTEDSWVTASNGAAVKLPSADWGSIEEPQHLVLPDTFKNITSFTVTSTNAFCFGMDNFYINEPPPVNLADLAYGQITIDTTPGHEAQDHARFKMTGLTDLGKAALKNSPVNPVELRFTIENNAGQIAYEFEGEGTVEGNKLSLLQVAGDTGDGEEKITCRLSTELCVIFIERDVDIDETVLDANPLTVTLEVNGTEYSNTGDWTGAVSAERTVYTPSE